MAQPTEVETPVKPAENRSVPQETHSASEPPAARSGNSLASRPHAKIIAIVVVLVLLVGGFFAYEYFQTYESTDDAQVDGHLMPLSARISGYVISVNVDDNQEVKAGTVLAEIDPKDYQVALDQAKAQLADAEASAQALNINVPIASVNSSSQISVSEADVENSRAGIAVAEDQLEAAKAQVAQAQANDVKAQNDLIRYKQLVDKQEISQQQFDQAVAAAKASSATVASAHATATAAAQQVTQAKSRLAQSQANLQNAQTGPKQVASTKARAISSDATVQQRQAAVEQAELNLQYTKIMAPVDGIVSKNAEVGMNVTPGQQLFTIFPLNDVWVTANFKETQLKHMRQGQPVKITVDANGRTYNGKVDSIAGSSGARTSLLPPENATGNYVKVVQRVPVKIILDPNQNSDHQLRLGMSVEPKVIVK